MPTNRVSSQDRHVPRNCLLIVAVEVMPIMLLEHYLAGFWILWVKCNLSLGVNFSVFENPVDLLELSLSLHRQIRRHHLCLKQNVNAPEFDSPSKNTHILLVCLYLITFQFRQRFQLGVVVHGQRCKTFAREVSLLCQAFLNVVHGCQYVWFR
jgi:hypothetical protein